MDDRDQRRLIFHGSIVLLIGSLCGFPEFNAVSHAAPEAVVHAWRVAHDALIGGGIMLIAIGAAMGHVTLGPRGGAWLIGALLAVAYGAVVGLGLPPLTGVRGLAPTGPAVNFIAFVGNFLVAAGTVIALPLLIWGARSR